MTRTMFDAVVPGNLPAGAPLYAGYVDGMYANVAQIKARFPGAIVVEIAVSASTDAGQVLDVENFDATPDEAPGWVQMRRAAGVDPSVYMNSSTWPAVRAAFQGTGVAEPPYWVAQYDGDPTIPAGAVAKQWADNGPYDTSSVADVWPGIDPQEIDMPLTPADAELVVKTLLGATVPNQFRLDAHGVPANTPVAAFLTFGDHHFDVLSGQLSSLAAAESAAKAELDAIKTTVGSVMAGLQALSGAASPTVAEVQAGIAAELAKLGAALGSLK